MSEGLGNGRLERTKQFSITGPDDGIFEGMASLQDSQHTMEVTVVVRVDSMEVVRVQGSITKAPFDICASAMEGLRSLEGMRVRPGLFGEMQKRVGGPKGCIHMNDLIREALQLIAAHRNLTEIRRMRGEGRTEQDIARWGEEIRSWTCTAAPDRVPGR